MRYIFLGDSITDCDHCYDPENLGYGYVRIIHEVLHKKDIAAQGNSTIVINKGFNGFTLPALKRLWKRDALTLNPDVLTILIGINDLCIMQSTGIDVSFAMEEFKIGYKSFIENIRQTYTGPIILMEPFIFPYPQTYMQWYENLTTMSQIVKTIAKQYHLTFIPLWEILLEYTKQLNYSDITTDGIHLTDTGHKILAEQWLQIIQGIS